MFTGIVEEVGIVKEIIPGSMSIRLGVKCIKIMEDVKVGDSIAVNGICLTVTSLLSTSFTADVMPETMRKTNLGGLKVGERVNLERALKMSDRLGGHIVSGHIDGTGIVSGKVEEDNAIWFEISAPSDILKYIVTKGSVALDGTSLTVAYVGDNHFKVSLIPLTAGVTTLGSKKTGDKINIECDMLGKYVEKLLGVGTHQQGEGSKGKTLDINFLRENGFV
ncbi:MAG: riboflavin synthase [Bacillota bacterium]